MPNPRTLHHLLSAALPSALLALPLTLALALTLTTHALAQPSPTEAGFIHVEPDVRLYYERYGTNEPVLFIPNRHELYLSFAPLLERYDVVTWDPRGRGLSDRPADLTRYGIDAEMADAEAIRQHFGVDEVVYLGGSLWANLAILYAARHPDSVRGVIALAPLPIAVSMMGDNPDAAHHALPAQRALVEQMAETETTDPDERQSYAYCVLEKRVFFSSSYVDLDNMDMLMDANICQYFNEQAHVATPVIFEGIFGSFGEWDWRDLAATVQDPVLLLFGANEGWDLTGVHAYAELLPNVQWAEVPNSGHHVWNEAHGMVMHEIEAFLKAHAEGGGGTAD